MFTILPDLTSSRQSSSRCDHSSSVSRAHRSSALVVTSNIWSPSGEIDAADRVGEWKRSCVMRETARIVASLVVLREMAVRQVQVVVVFSGNPVLVIDCDHVVR